VVSFCEVLEWPERELAEVPIGRPIAGARLFVADAQCGLAPIGVAGELLIGGAGLARGYHAQPALTAERFTPDPFGPAAGGRLYRSGDRARRRPDGRLEYLGRIDQQVKIRGFRVEPAEIESVLRTHPGVREAVVVAWERAGVRRLAAYVVAEAGLAPEESELRRFLRARLPDYMVPALLVPLATLPLSPHGKVDRRRLPEPGPELGLAAADPVAPRDGIELRLARLWEELLGVQPVGVTDSFFDLGGHSLLALRMMARIRAELGRELPVAALFERPTIEQLAAALREQGMRAAPSVLVPVRADGDGAPLLCVHPVGGTVLCYAELARHLGAGRPLFGLQHPHLAGETGEAASVEELAATYVRAVRSARPGGPRLLAGWSMGALVALEMARQLRAAGEAVGLVALIDPTTPGDETDREADEAALVLEFARDLAGLRGLTASSADLAGSDPLDRLLALARAEGQVPPDVGLADLRRHFEVFRRNLKAAAAYRPVAWPGPLALVVADRSPAAEAARLAAWRHLAAGSVEVHRLPGDHYSLLRPPDVGPLAALLRSLLARCGGPQGDHPVSTAGQPPAREDSCTTLEA
jgi:thioesterase domain-containing protein/acyl carrier protein